MTPAETLAGAPCRLTPTRIGGRLFEWGRRTYIMGIVNVTPDSFSGDGLLGRADGDPAAAAAAQAARMIEEGADIVDVGGESTRPGHAPVALQDELSRVLPAVAAIRRASPDAVISIDTCKVEVAAAALDAGADFLNDIWGTGSGDSMARLAAARQVPLVVMHNREQPLYENFAAELLADLRVALDRAIAIGVRPDNLLVDPGFGFGKTPAHNLEAMRRLADVRGLGHPVLLGTSRKSTLGKVLEGLPPEARLEATLATTALGIAAGVDVIRVHDVQANCRAARMSDAIVRGGVLP